MKTPPPGMKKHNMWKTVREDWQYFTKRRKSRFRTELFMGSENCNQSEWRLTQSQDGFRKINSNTLIQMGPQSERTFVELDFSLGLNFKLKMIKHSPLADAPSLCSPCVCPLLHILLQKVHPCIKTKTPATSNFTTFPECICVLHELPDKFSLLNSGSFIFCGT